MTQVLLLVTILASMVPNFVNAQVTEIIVRRTMVQDNRYLTHFLSKIPLAQFSADPRSNVVRVTGKLKLNLEDVPENKQREVRESFRKLIAGEMLVSGAQLDCTNAEIEILGSQSLPKESRDANIRLENLWSTLLGNVRDYVRRNPDQVKLENIAKLLPRDRGYWPPSEDDLDFVEMRLKDFEPYRSILDILFLTNNNNNKRVDEHLRVLINSGLIQMFRSAFAGNEFRDAGYFKIKMVLAPRDYQSDCGLLLSL